MAIHGPNRIIVRDEKGNKTVRRASHLKLCDLKMKVASMIPEQSEYSRFGRSTKLLLHPRDVPDLQFTSKTEEKGEISPNTDIIEIDLAITPGRVDCGKIPPNRGKNSPDSHDNSVIKSNIQSITGYKQKMKEEGEIPLGIVTDSQTDDRKHNWFYSPINCISKWSKALKQGVANTMGLESSDAAMATPKENDKLGFSFFL